MCWLAGKSYDCILMSVVYRLTGTVADAEIVREDLKAWLIVCGKSGSAWID